MNENYFENLFNQEMKRDNWRDFVLPDDEEDEAVRQLRLRVDDIGISSSINVDEHCLRRNWIGSKWWDVG